MSGIDISNLSYKELQALALRYRVPGNIKKQLLIEVLQAARCGNEQEVDKLLADLRQTRKKRIRKGKPMKLTMSLSSTPIHSPTYDMADDYYSTQHRLPYQWVGAEEEISNRQDESNRVPQYEEFRQFLLRRIQRDYQTYNTNHNDKVVPGNFGGIMDLRNDQGESMRFEANTEVGIRSNLAAVNGLQDAAQSNPEPMGPGHNGAFDYQISDDPNGNGSASILLRRMLQAPVGTDLGEIASPELGSSCRIWGAEYQSQNNLLDNSDTLSANSDVNATEDTSNWPIGTEYYRFVNNVRDQLIMSQGNALGNRSYDQQTAGQFCGVLAEENPLQYQLLYANHMNELQQQQQQQQHGQQHWETATAFDTDAASYQRLKTTGTYYDGISATNYAAGRPLANDPLHQQYPNEDGGPPAGYSAANQNAFEGNNSSASTASRSEVKFYHNLNGNANACETQSANATNCSYTFVKPGNHSNTYYDNPSGEGQQLQAQGFIPPMQHLAFSSNNQNLQAPPPAHNGYVESLGCTSGPLATAQSSQIEEFNRPSIFGQYQMVSKINTFVENAEQMYQCEDGDVIAKPEGEGETETQDKTILGSTSTMQSDSTMSLEPFWPQRSTGKVTTENCLENILNLNAYGYVDYSKIDQTSCIYCYSAPIVTQRLFSANSSCSQKKRFVAEFRQHTFSPYWLLYNDTTTGLQMSKHDRTGGTATDSVETGEDEIMENSGKEVKSIAIDAQGNVDNTQLPDINGSELRSDEEQLNLEMTELVAIPTDRSHSKEIASFDEDVQLDLKSEAGSGDVDDPGEDQSSVNLNMENTSRIDELQDVNYDVSVMELTGNPSVNS